MTREEIFALFARREAAWRRRDAAALAADHAPDGVVVSPTGGVLEGRADIERIYRVWFVAFPDLTFTHRGSAGRRRPRGAAVPGHRRPRGRVLRHAADRAPHRMLRRRSSTGFENDLIVHERRILDFTGLLVQVGVLRAKPAG